MNYIWTVSLFVNIFLIVLTFSRCENLCKEKSPCRCTLANGTAIDLSTVGKDDNVPLFYDVLYVKSEKKENETNFEVEGLYSYNPCYAFTETRVETSPPPDELPCKAAAACKIAPGTGDGSPPQLYAIGMQELATFTEDKNGFINIVYRVPNAPSNLTVRLICNETEQHFLSVVSSNKTGYYMNLTSKCACPGACESKEPLHPSEHGLSTGSVLLITFFTILLVYVFVGIVWNFCNGAHGIELLPNIRFWSDVPQLIVDGFLFTCSFCSTRRSQNSYSDM